VTNTHRPKSDEQGDTIETRQPRASVVIPNFNGMSHLPECLATLSSQSFADFEVVMVDNASTDESVEWVRREHPWVRIVQRLVNGGPIKSINDGIRASQGEYVVLLNNDTAAEPEWLGSLVEALDDHHDFDFAASMMILYFEDDLLNAAGDVFSVRHMEARNRGFGQRLSQFARSERVLSACGGAAIYRRALFDEVGLFDEDFFWIGEDIDFGVRCLIRGKRCLYVPTARIRHKTGICRDTTESWEMERAVLRNMAGIAAKNLPLPLLAGGLLIQSGHLVRQAVPLRPSNWRLVPVLMGHSLGSAGAVVEGLRMGWSKRHDVWRSRIANRAEIYRCLLRGYGPV
jgi:GT2 family glycosyltransferase